MIRCPAHSKDERDKPKANCFDQKPFEVNRLAKHFLEEIAFLSIKGTPREDGSWHENVENAQIFPFASFVRCSVNIHATEVLICFKLELLRGKPCWFVFTNEEQKEGGS